MHKCTKCGIILVWEVFMVDSRNINLDLSKAQLEYLLKLVEKDTAGANPALVNPFALNSVIELEAELYDALEQFKSA